MGVSWVVLLVWAVVAYLLGSIPSGYLLVKFFLKKDVRQQGSGNIGATNVLRVGNTRLAVLTYVFDMVKIWIPLWLFAKFMDPFNDIPDDTMVLYLAVLGAFGVIGHMYSVWLKFNGGKGVASVAGYFLWLFPYVAVFSFFVFVVIAFATRIVSIASLTAVLVGYVYALIYQLQRVDSFDDVYGAAISMLSLVVVLIVLRHKENIKRLINGTENKIRFLKKG